jgi:hypothetical protein
LEVVVPGLSTTTVMLTTAANATTVLTTTAVLTTTPSLPEMVIFSSFLFLSFFSF